MKKVVSTLTIAAMVVLFISGCAGTKHRKRTVEDKPESVYRSDGLYYYYIESQLQLKKGNLDQAEVFLKKAAELDPETEFLKNELVMLYLRKKEHQKALDLIEGLLYVDPNNVNALIIYGRIKQTLKQYDDAKQTYHKIIEIDPKQQNIYMFLGGLYMDEGDLISARQTYTRFVENFPDSYVGHFFLGKIYAQEGMDSAAEAEFQKTLQLRPDLEEPKFELIDLYKTQGKTDNVIRLYSDILQNDPGHIRATMELGNLFHQTGNAEKAEALFRNLGARIDSEPEIIRTFAKLYLDTKKYDAAVIVVNGMLEETAENSDLHYAAGVTYDGKGDKEKAVHHFKMVKPDTKFYQSAVVHISFLYQDMGRIDEGIGFLKDAIGRFPDNPDLWMYLGSFYEEVEDYAKAEDALQKGLKLSPDNSKIFFRLGVVYDKWGQKDSSIEAMKQVIKLDPQNANALNYLGYTYADLGKNLDEAERLIKEALKYKPDDGYITDSLGWVYYKKGMIEEALHFLEKAIKLVPDDPVILEHLGDAYLKANDKDTALDYYNRSLRLRKKDKIDIEKKIQQLTGKGP